MLSIIKPHEMNQSLINMLLQAKYVEYDNSSSNSQYLLTVNGFQYILMDTPS